MAKNIDPMATAQALIGQMMATRENHFLLTWEGSKIPRGATVDGVQIGWTQHGLVTGAGGEQLGEYERITEFGGATGNTQVMLIGTNGKSITPPPGGKVEKVELPPLMTDGPASEGSKLPEQPKKHIG
jgi:hypothetical protein